MLKKSIATALAAACMLCGAAQATPMSATLNLSIYNGANLGSGATSTSESAFTSNPLIAPAYLLQTTSYTGPLTFAATVDTIGSFLSSGGGVFTPTLTGATAATALSTSNFGTTTVLVFTGTLTAPVSGTILHDDGIGLYQGGVLVTPSADAAPTSAETTSFSLAPGAFELVYVEANGLPAILNISLVPEPASMALMGAGLVGLGMIRRRMAA